jgi:osmotically-inducible protein OsmY
MGPWYNFDDRSWTITDDEVKDNVLEAINSDTGIPPRDRKKIKAGVKKGIVTLYGRVSQKRSRLTATDDAYWSPGVLDVVNNINLSSSH